jgi:yeast amino acid transporter
MTYLAAPLVLALWFTWKCISGNWRLYIPLKEVDLVSGARFRDIDTEDDEPKVEKTWKNLPRRVLGAFF